MQESLQNWVTQNKLKIEPFGDGDILYTINGEVYIFIEIKKDYIYEKFISEGEVEDITEDLLFHPLQEKMYLLLDDKEEYYLQEAEPKYYLFQFGECFYYHLVNSDNLITKPKSLKYIGQAEIEIDLDYCNLGVRGGYELLNGSGNYDDWIEKTKFLGYKSLGICEKNTLAGTLPFQLECKKKGIKSILGETISIKRSDESMIEGKVYVIDKLGWNHLLHINKYINVDNVANKYITEEELFRLSENLIFVFSSETPLSKKLIALYKKQKFHSIYYQFDSSEYLSDQKDKDYLLSLKNYIDEYISLIEPKFVNDSFYLDEEYYHIKKILNSIGSIHSYQAKNQHYKSLDDIFNNLAPLFSEEKLYNKQSFIDIFKICTENTIKVSEACNFEIETKVFKLPTYNFEYDGLTGKELLRHLVEVAFEEQIKGKKENEQVYRDRVEMELGVIEKGGFVDYFLINWDIFDWCEKQGIYTGIGRGSAAASAVLWLLKVTRVDPIKFNLYFERFLSEARLEVSMPDVDSDCMSSRRNEIKRYMEQRFGLTNVCSVGTYTTLKLKAALKDVGRQLGIDNKKINYINSCIEEREDWDWFDLFGYANNNSVVKKFIQDNFELINDIKICLGQPRSTSIHAAAVIVTPEIDHEGNKMTIFDWFPVKEIDGILVSEWEGTFLAKAGFLKEDILGIKQLDKFKSIVELIKETTGDEIDIYNIPLDDFKTYEMFKKGFNEDIFQFGAVGLGNYVKEMQPDSINDLINANALYRPGPIGINAHNEYILIKNGKKELKYDLMCEEITKNTYGLIIFQEQVMAYFRTIGNLSMVEADNIRRSINKDVVLFNSYKDVFITNGRKGGYSEIDIEYLWDKIEEFSAYSFNLAHAASYSITGYVSQWLKANYPLQFYTVSLQQSDDDKITGKMVEINKIGKGIKLNPPDINSSDNTFRLDLEKKAIYWSLSRISFMGDKSLQHIVNERNNNGQFFSFEEFLKRVEKKYCNRRLVKNLILSGAFDEIENIIDPHGRYKLIEYLYEWTKNDDIEEDFNVLDVGKDYYFTMLQKNMCGYGMFSFEKIIKESSVFKDEKKIKHINGEYLLREDIERSICIVGGIIINIIERKTKNGPMGVIELLNGSDIVYLTIWPDYWLINKHLILKAKGKIIFFQGIIKLDSYKKKNVLYSYEESKIDIL